MSGGLTIFPMTLRGANAYIEAHHRHHKKVRGHKFSIGLKLGDETVGVCVVGRPVARGLDDGLTAEVTRLCTDGVQHGCSMLYGAAWRAAKAMGYRHIVTYILTSESGISLKAAGWDIESEVRGRSWSCESRPRLDKHPLDDKVRWGKQMKEIQ